MNKINIFPIFKDHFGTFCDSRGKRLPRDYVLFVGAPVLVGIIGASVGFRPTPEFVDFLLLANSIFIPLIVNVLFVIYGIKERQVDLTDTPDTPRNRRKSTKLLDHLYKNLLYAVVIACLTVLVLGLTKLLSLPPIAYLPTFAKSAAVMMRPWWEWTIYAISYTLLTHTALTVLMVAKRTHALLADVVENAPH